MIRRLLRTLRLAAHGRHATGGHLPPPRDPGDGLPAMLSPGGPVEAVQCRKARMRRPRFSEQGIWIQRCPLPAGHDGDHQPGPAEPLDLGEGS